ncbi:hypothetical protein DU508_11850 [Pedobacter chinensis]|uniref:Uncharacterized protein n=1 Tax=Pedobacter chinensis TaxID=2282421 RepID=A0A369PYK6_9SPHI|nr:hypothetical protein [Pedobacter chinensis]RDC56295.1 hypothetical protein DU508_11850 [Pedobacter chinensis]
MKKIMLSKGMFIACLVVFCLFSITTCRKDQSFPKSSLRLQNTALIKPETINTWFQKTPAAKLLSPDWSKAKQRIIDGKKIVRVPVSNIDKTSLLNNDNGSVINNQNLNYYEIIHPSSFL